MKEVLIIGAGDFGKELAWQIEDLIEQNRLTMCWIFWMVMKIKLAR